MGQPELFITTGLIGAGKTEFSRRLAIDEGIAFINADEVRLEYVEYPNFSAEETQRVYEMVDERASKYLEQGESVICNGNYNRFAERERMRKLAHGFAQTSFHILLVEAPYELLRQRAVSRDHEIPPEKRVDSPLAVLDFIVDAFEHPVGERSVIWIDGTHDYADQKAAYYRQKYSIVTR